MSGCSHSAVISFLVRGMSIIQVPSEGVAGPKSTLLFSFVDPETRFPKVLLLTYTPPEHQGSAGHILKNTRYCQTFQPKLF